MTIDRMTLKALVEKGCDDDLLREMMTYVANRLMDLEGFLRSLDSCSRSPPGNN